MDAVIVAEKLEALRQCIKRIEDRRVQSADALYHDLDRQDILSVNLTRAVQLCVDMAAHVVSDTRQPAPQTMGETFDLLCAEGIIEPALRDRMRAAVGFRNVAVHSYQAIDWNIVHTITHEGLADFKAFARSIVAMLDHPAPR
ncbi:type VII toxin-antitoxin system HepT family RNase toxin [Aquisalimonas sp. APHAB1-3]|uniref:type VII toxin-antitoxin system HepT family RNase toxin n=1 Tax=Aquisalimonas sp. APHAB1-3 TaxID=3402080 RepID=UPI003AAFD8FF